MMLDLVNITKEDIELSSSRSVEEKNTFVMYSQNNGNPAHEWRLSDLCVWINESIEYPI